MQNILHTLSAIHPSTLTASAASGHMIAAFLITLAVIILIGLGLCALMIAAQWQMFKKAGMPGWAAIVPFYSTTKMLQMVNYPLWWVIVIMMVPFVNIVLYVMLAKRLARVFGHSGWFALGMIFLPFIFYPIIGFGSSKYKNQFPTARPMSEAIKWSLAAFILFMITFSSSGYHEPVTTHEPLHTVGTDTGYVSDDTYVYYDDVLLPDADASSFTTEGDYGIDDYSVYSYGKKLPGVDSQDFKILADGIYAKTSTNVYFDSSVITDADPVTFTSLGETYAKDNHAVYFDGDKIQNADPSTFQLLQMDYTKDASNVYFDGEVIKDADPATFVVIPQGRYDYESSNAATYDAKDKNHNYYAGEVAPGK